MIINIVSVGGKPHMSKTVTFQDSDLKKANVADLQDQSDALMLLGHSFAKKYEIKIQS